MLQIWYSYEIARTCNGYNECTESWNEYETWDVLNLCFWMDCGSRYETCQEKLRNIYYHFLIVSRWITGLTTIHPDTEQHHPHHTGTPEDAEQTQNTHTIPKSSEAPRPSGAQSMIRGEENKGRIVSSTHHQTNCILGYPSIH